MTRLSRKLPSHPGLVIGRAFFPLFAIAIIAGAMVWGPWVSLGITVLAFCIELRFL